MQREAEEARAVAQEVSSAQEAKATLEEEVKNAKAALEGKAKQLDDSARTVKQLKVGEHARSEIHRGQDRAMFTCNTCNSGPQAGHIQCTHTCTQNFRCQSRSR